MEIISYKKVKGNVYEITLTGGIKHKLYDDLILKYELLLDKRIDQKKLDKIVSENNELDAYYKAVKYIGVKMRTKLEIRKYLEKYDVPSKTIDLTITKLIKEGLISEERYAEAFVNDAILLSLNGPRKIRDNLIKLGIKEEFFSSFIDRIPHDVWQDRIEKVIAKKAKLNKLGESLFKRKMANELFILGYYTEDINNVLDGLDFDMGDVFLREADKMYEKLSRKYEGAELKAKFKSKMYTKGFEMDAINSYLRDE